MRNNSEVVKEAIQVANQIYSDYSRIFVDPLQYRCDSLLVSVIESEGIFLDSHPFSGDLCGFLYIDEFETTLVYNNNQPQVRRNFTLGHELGHYFLHRDKESQFADRTKDLLDNTINIFEMQANAFSAQLLLPDEVLVSMLRENYLFHGISKKVFISYEALTWRIVNYLTNKYGMKNDDALLIVEDYKDFSIASIKNLISHRFAIIFFLNKDNFLDLIKIKRLGFDNFKLIKDSDENVVAVESKKYSRSGVDILGRLFEFHFTATKKD